MTNSKYQGAVDLSGATVSLLCAIHCTVTPLFFLAKPILNTTTILHGSQSFWEMLDWIFLLLSIGPVWYSAKYTLHQSFSYLLWIFWFVFAVGLLLEIYGFEKEKWLMYFGSMSLAVTHILNYKYCKECDDEKYRRFH